LVKQEVVGADRVLVQSEHEGVDGKKGFQNWVRSIGCDVGSAERHILHLSDNISFNQTGDHHLTNVTVEHPPRNTTAICFLGIQVK
jgi:hypothetical protein